jgi:AdoMet-dependent rRNA methyltransferase SPB1
MPVNSLIIGVDLAPIKSIPRTITFQSDITTDKCRAIIRQHLKTWKADTVLHDGAPNVGTAWVQDAFTQAELALQAMKLATEFLAEGGTFVTKVFRSKDYNSLIWVFNQLFTKVEATKPPASRNVSAEIFVVCRGFKAPKRIDPKFLDPRSVFAELADPTPNNEAKVFNPEKKKRKRDGYAEGDHTQFKEAPVTSFIQTTDPIAMLGGLNKLSFEHKRNGDIALVALEKLPETTREIQDCCADLKVLGRKEFRSLLKWRLKVREIFGLASKKTFAEEKDEAEEVAEVAPMDEDLRIQEELQLLDEQESGRRKRERRRKNERKQKEIVRMQLRMTTPTEIGLEQSGPNGEDAMFALKMVDNAGAVDKVAKGKMNAVVAQEKVKSRNARTKRQTKDSSESEDEGEETEEDVLERELDSMYEQYQERRSIPDAKYRAKKARKEHEDGEWEGFPEKDESSDDNVVLDESSEDSSDVEEPGNLNSSLITTFATNEIGESGLTRQTVMFFDQEIFKGINGLNDTAKDNEHECTLTGSLNVNSSSLLENTKNGHPSNGKLTKPEAIILHKPAEPGVTGAIVRDTTSFELVKRTKEKGGRQGHPEPRRDSQSGWLINCGRLRYG